MKALQSLTMALLILAVSTTAWSQEAPPAKDTEKASAEAGGEKKAEDPKEDAGAEILRRQKTVRQRYERLETLLFNKAALEASDNPRRASLLRKAFQQSKSRLTTQQLAEVVAKLEKGSYKPAIGG
ncbi:MAG: hypothetical protein QF805_30690, partial [Pirellulaceae bacterium]|nr:hypothetical protein [Pirellulaceae bacterium]